jgi:hypothetical protein
LVAPWIGLILENTKTAEKTNTTAKNNKKYFAFFAKTFFIFIKK